MRVLVAEDNPINQTITRQMLKKLGYDVEAAGNGWQAAEAALAGDFDLILMDCHMPELDGLAATRIIRRAEGARRRVPIIALTADIGIRDCCLEAGMDDYLTKPVQIEALTRVIASWLRPSIEETDQSRTVA